MQYMIQMVCVDEYQKFTIKCHKFDLVKGHGEGSNNKLTK